MKILITGANGQLGRACQTEFRGHTLFLADIDIFDLTKPRQCARAIRSFSPAVIIHTAAYTDVKGAETHQSDCYAVNVAGTIMLARLASQWSATMVYISTDYVFDGRASKPYDENNAPRPINVYGRSKYAGELAVMDLVPNFFIVRTAWLYGEGNNFVRTIVSLAASRRELKIVGDQRGTPTSTVDLAHYIAVVLEKGQPGIYHATNDGTATWAEFAQEILRQSHKTNPVIPITTSEAAVLLNDPTPRPSYTVLSKQKLKKLTKVRPWQKALAQYIATF